MKLFCPYCGIKGTAKDSFYNRKVNCPGCKEAFTIDCGIIEDSHQKRTEEKLSQYTDIPQKTSEAEEVQVVEVTETEVKTLTDTQLQVEQVCSSCRATIEKGTEYILGNGVYCTDCVPVPVP